MNNTTFLKSIGYKDIDTNCSIINKIVLELNGIELLKIPRRPIKNGKSGECLDAVDSKMRAHGGQSIYGWDLLQMNGIIEAEAHVVWKSKKGELIDVTPVPAPLSFLKYNYFVPIKSELHLPFPPTKVWAIDESHKKEAKFRSEVNLLHHKIREMLGIDLGGISKLDKNDFFKVVDEAASLLSITDDLVKKRAVSLLLCITKIKSDE